jgi:hypothetical protein
MSKKPIDARQANPNRKIEFTPTEANALLKIITTAVKAVGIDDGGKLSQEAIHFKNKIMNAFNIKEGDEKKAEDKPKPTLKAVKGGKK